MLVPCNLKCYWYCIILTFLLTTALAFASLKAFIPKYLYKFFLKDNSAVIQGKQYWLVIYSSPAFASLKSFIANAAVILACCLPLFRFDDDICVTAQAQLAAERWPSGKQRLANKLITPHFVHHGRLQTVDFNSTREGCRSAISQSSVAAKSCNHEMVSDNHVA